MGLYLVTEYLMENRSEENVQNKVRRNKKKKKKKMQKMQKITRTFIRDRAKYSTRYAIKIRRGKKNSAEKQLKRL